MTIVLFLEEEEMGDDGTSLCIPKEGLINKKLIAKCYTKNYDQCTISRLCKLRNKEKKKKKKKQARMEEEEMGDGESVCIAKEGLINKKLIAGCLTKNYEQCKTSRLCKLRNKEKKKKSKKQARMEEEEMGDDGTSLCIPKEGLINKKLIAKCYTKNYDQCTISRLCKLRNKEKKKKKKKQTRMDEEEVGTGSSSQFNYSPFVAIGLCFGAFGLGYYSSSAKRRYEDKYIELL